MTSHFLWFKKPITKGMGVIGFVIGIAVGFYLAGDFIIDEPKIWWWGIVLFVVYMAGLLTDLIFPSPDVKSDLVKEQLFPFAVPFFQGIFDAVLLAAIGWFVSMFFISLN